MKAITVRAGLRSGSIRTGVFLLALACGLAATMVAADAPPAPPPPAGAAQKASKIAVIFLETVISESKRSNDILKVYEDLANKLKEKMQEGGRIANQLTELQNNMGLGVGDPAQMEERWLNLQKQLFKVQREVSELKAAGSDELKKRQAALMVDINSAIEAVALREHIDIVINRKDAELAAVEKKKLRETMLERTSLEDGKKETQRDNKLDEDLDREMKQQMLGKLENTFVWSNDSMDITGAVVKQLNKDYEDNKFTNWRDMPSSGDAGGLPGGGPAPTERLPE